MVFQTESFFTHTNEKHDNFMWKDHLIYKSEHQKFWNNFEKLNRKPEIFKLLIKYWKQM